MSLKTNILDELNKNRGKDISGQSLAEKFGVSRNAVWKAINSLKKDGYDIISGTNKGYCLSESSDVVSVNEIQKRLNYNKLPIYFYDSIDSTNDEAKRLLINKDGENQFLIVSNEQTNGRGRQGKNFYSPKSSGIYFTLVICPNTNIENIIGITSYTAVCIAKAIRDITNKNAQIKWVNDVFIDGKKVCGILTEAISDFETGTVSNILIGIGINLSPYNLPDDLKDIAGFINSKKAVKNQLISEIVNGIMKYDKNKDDYINDYKNMSMILGKEIKCNINGNIIPATAIDIDNKAGLIIKTEQGIQTINSGNILL